MKKLPIGIQTFEKLRGEDYLYIDKTPQILRLIQSGEYFFLSRPRRFGKSLLISTLKDIFLGNQDLFQGLFIYDKIEWKRCPVIHLDLSLISRETDERLKQELLYTLEHIAGQYQVTLGTTYYDTAFRELIEKLDEKYQEKVTVLIDEYDKPIIDHIDSPDMAKKNREVLRNFYGILKGSDAHLRFVFLTGVSKFSQVSVFSGLNNLNDITLSPHFATLTGYTQDELEHYFAEHIQHFCHEQGLERSQLLKKIKHWYNGYSWNGKDSVYNPFSVLKLFEEQRFRNYWFATGTPTFLIKQVKHMKVETTEFENKEVSDMVFESYDIDRMNIFALLFQTGYLTITHAEEDEGMFYMLNYPNNEVKTAFLTYLFESFTENRLDEVQSSSDGLRRHLRRENYDGFMNIIRALFAKIPYTLHIPQEAYYHSLFYMILELMGVEIDLEVLTDKGRIDGVLECDDKVFIIEFKYGKSGSDMNELTQKAVCQIQNKNYGDRFLNDLRKQIFLGVGFTGKEIGYQITNKQQRT